MMHFLKMALSRVHFAWDFLQEQDIPESNLLQRVSNNQSWAFATFYHRWASASRKLTPASAFRHPSSQSDTGPKKCRTASLYSGTGQVFSSPVPDHPDVGQSGIPVVLIVHI
jgi:hypothetical protein